MTPPEQIVIKATPGLAGIWAKSLDLILTGRGDQVSEGDKAECYKIVEQIHDQGVRP